MKKQIFAMGGGGFSMEPDNPLLDHYILSLSEKKEPKICFVPTASGDSEGYIRRFYDFFENQACKPYHLSLFKPPQNDLESYIMGMDIIYVGGGNTVNLLVLWKEWGMDRIFRRAMDSGIILAGLSAGSICWFEEGVTDSLPDELSSLTCLGFIKGSNCPHYDGESDRRPSYHKLIASKKIQGGIAADDGVGLHYINNELVRIVSSRPNAKAYSVEDSNSYINEAILDVEFLGNR